MIDASEFSVNEQAGKYYATLKISGTMRVEIDAESIEDARDQAETKADKVSEDIFDIEIDYVDDVDVYHVQAKPKMYRVMSEGKKMQVIRLDETCTPRDPDERGF
jgi:hypothetical protein